MRYHLRTLLVVLGLAPPVLAGLSITIVRAAHHFASIPPDVWREQVEITEPLLERGVGIAALIAIVTVSVGLVRRTSGSPNA
jgi:hypothetical protein